MPVGKKTGRQGLEGFLAHHNPSAPQQKALPHGHPLVKPFLGHNVVPSLTGATFIPNLPKHLATFQVVIGSLHRKPCAFPCRTQFVTAACHEIDFLVLQAVGV